MTSFSSGAGGGKNTSARHQQASGSVHARSFIHTVHANLALTHAEKEKQTIGQPTDTMCTGFRIRESQRCKDLRPSHGDAGSLEMLEASWVPGGGGGAGEGAGSPSGACRGTLALACYITLPCMHAPEQGEVSEPTGEVFSS